MTNFKDSDYIVVVNTIYLFQQELWCMKLKGEIEKKKQTNK